MKKGIIIEKSIDCFMKEGLNQVSMRMICADLDISKEELQNYFPSKEELIIACAEDCAKEIEEKLVSVALEYVTKPEEMVTKLQQACLLLSRKMKFFTSIFVNEKYVDLVTPVLTRLETRYEIYALEFAKKLKCSVDIVRPYVFLAIFSISNYMIYSTSSLFNPQFEVFINFLNVLKNKN